MRFCPICGTQLKGRSDKKFCSDKCRNIHFNRNKQKLDCINIINRTLKRNRKILEELNPGGTTLVHKSILTNKGFDFNYYTSTELSKSGGIQVYCYDYGYAVLENDFLALIVNQSN